MYHAYMIHRIYVKSLTPSMVTEELGVTMLVAVLHAGEADVAEDVSVTTRHLTTEETIV